MMTDTRSRVLQIIYSVMDEINQMFPEIELEKAPETPLLGGDGQLDSLGFVHLIITTEQRIQEEFALDVYLTDERAMAESNSPFRTVGTLADYITLLMLEVEVG